MTMTFNLYQIIVEVYFLRFLEIFKILVWKKYFWILVFLRGWNFWLYFHEKFLVKIWTKNRDFCIFEVMSTEVFGWNLRFFV
jgi:hypothetical protein